MAAAVSNDTKAREYATQKQVKRCLDPLRKQGESLLGCLGALVMIALTVLLLTAGAIVFGRRRRAAAA